MSTVHQRTVGVKRVRLLMIATLMTCAFLAGRFSGQLSAPRDPLQDTIATLPHATNPTSHGTEGEDVGHVSIEFEEDSEPSEGFSEETVTEPVLDPSEWTDDPVFRTYDETFAYEPVDEIWAQQSESQIWSGLSASSISVSSVKVHCRSTLCRLEMTHSPSRVEEYDSLGRLEDRDSPRSVEQRDSTFEGLNRLVRLTIGEDGPPEAIVGASARGIIDDQGYITSHVVYFFREKRAPPNWLLTPDGQPTVRSE